MSYDVFIHGGPDFESKRVEGPHNRSLTTVDQGRDRTRESTSLVVTNSGSGEGKLSGGGYCPVTFPHFRVEGTGLRPVETS